MADDWNVLVRQPHTLDRDEAKRRVDEKIAEVIENKQEWSPVSSWTSTYTYTFELTGGNAAGVNGEIKVWGEQVVLKCNLTENLAGFTSLIEQKAQSKLANILA
ncbi:MAG: polyhydroxyalkanoic acid system family protein [Myxococcales bacterium]|nr:polyhydroxyalkanoic acid system family protein [Myxococcales bacterium]